jgi:heme exporter protein A
MTSASLWILDEPLNALDTAGIALVHGLLAAHLHGGGTAVLTSHLPVAVPGHVLRDVMLG